MEFENSINRLKSHDSTSIRVHELSVNGFCYDVTIKLYQHHEIKSNMCRGHVPDAINVLDGIL